MQHEELGKVEAANNHTYSSHLQLIPNKPVCPVTAFLRDLNSSCIEKTSNTKSTLLSNRCRSTNPHNPNYPVKDILYNDVPFQSNSCLWTHRIVVLVSETSEGQFAVLQQKASHRSHCRSDFGSCT